MHNRKITFKQYVYKTFTITYCPINIKCKRCKCMLFDKNVSLGQKRPLNIAVFWVLPCYTNSMQYAYITFTITYCPTNIKCKRCKCMLLDKNVSLGVKCPLNIAVFWVLPCYTNSMQYAYITFTITYCPINIKCKRCKCLLFDKNVSLGQKCPLNIAVFWVLPYYTKCVLSCT